MINKIKKIQSNIDSINLKNVSQKRFVRNVFIVASGTAMAQIITMLFSPIITRIYGPDIYGVFGVYTSMVNIFIPIVALTYPTAIVLPKNELEARGLVRLSIYITVIISTIIFLLFMLFKNTIVGLLNIEVLAPYLLFIPLMMFFDGFFQIANQWLIRKKQFQVKAKVAIIHSLVTNSTYSGLGFLYPFSATLIIVATLGKGLYSLLLVWGAGMRTNVKVTFDKLKVSKNDVSTILLAKKYKDFPIYRSPQVFIHGISESLPILILTTFFGPAAAAFFAIGIKVLGVPTQLIGNAVGDVFYPRISEGANRGENIAKLLIKANLSLAIIGLIPYGLVVLFGPWLFTLVYGSEWSTAGVYASFLSLFSYFLFITRPTIKTLQVIGEQRFHLIFTIVAIILRLSGLIIGGYIYKSDIIAVILYSVLGIILYTYLAVVIIIKCKVFQRTIRNFSK